MDGRGDDFEAYVALRWPVLVRTLVLLDCPPDRAEAVAETALARCHRTWRRIRRSGDVDVRVFRRLLRTWPATRRRHTRRTALVLITAGLSEAQVGAVLGRGTTDLAEDEDRPDLLGPDPATFEVGPAPVAGILGASTRSLVVRRRGLAVATAVAVVVAALVAVLLRVPEPVAEQASPPVTHEQVPVLENPSVAPYLTDGRLHVGGQSLPARAVTDLSDPGVGAVYRTQEGDVVLVDKNGGTAEIGHNVAPGLAADPSTGRVFWLTYAQQLVVYDAREGHPVSTRVALDPVADFRYARPLALTAGVAYYAIQGAVRAWDLASNRLGTTGVGRPTFLDRVGDLEVGPTRDGRGIVASRRGTQLWQHHGMVAPRASLSPDGRRVVVVDVGQDAAMFDAETGSPTPTGLPVRTRVSAATFIGAGGTAYVTNPDSAHSALVECRGREPRCRTLVTVRGALTVAR